MNTRTLASLSLLGGQDTNISSIVPHFPVCSLIFLQSFFIFFLILEGPGYVTDEYLHNKKHTMPCRGLTCMQGHPQGLGRVSNSPQSLSNHLATVSYNKRENGKKKILQ